MRKRRGAWGQLALLVLSLMGAGITIYLTTVHYENVPLVCSTNGVVDCARVLSSSYSLVPGTTIPITIPGLGWCLVIAGLAILALSVRPERRWIRMAQLAQFAWSLLGIVAVLYLVYAEIVALHTICAWCTALHVIILVIFLISMVQLRQAEPDPELETEEEERKITTKSR